MKTWFNRILKNKKEINYVSCMSQDYLQGANEHEDNGFVIAKELKFKKLKYLTEDC